MDKYWDSLIRFWLLVAVSLVVLALRYGVATSQAIVTNHNVIVR